MHSHFLRRAVIAVCLLALMTSAAFAQTYTWKNVEIRGGGFTPGIVFSEAEQGLVYHRTDIGGAYRLDNNTGRWVPMLDWVGWDNWGYSGVFSLAADPSNANNVYCAVGNYTNGWDPNNGAILRSNDRGQTWSVAPLPFKIGGNMPGRGNGERLQVDPNNSNIIYYGAGGNATTTFGLWKSTNGGASFSQVTSFTAQGDWSDLTVAEDQYDYQSHKQGISWVQFDKRFVSNGVTQHIYVAVSTKNGPTIWRSTDGGSTWAAVSGQPLADCGGNKLLPTKGKIDPVNGFLYVTYGFKAGPYDDPIGEVFKYNTATGAWTNISPVANACIAVGQDGADPYHGYNGLTIDRQNPSTIMVTGHSSWWPDTIIWRSTNGGQTWSKIWDWTSYPNRSYRFVANSTGGIADVSVAPWLTWPPRNQAGGRPGPDPQPMLGWMTASLEIDPFNSDRMMYGTGATIYGTNDLTVWDQGATTQINITPFIEGQEETAIQVLCSPAAGPDLLSGMYDIYGFVHQNVDVVPSSFYSNPRNAVLTIDYAELSPSIIWRAGSANASEPGSNAGPPTDGGAVGYSTNGGSSWTAISFIPANSSGGGTIAVSANGTRVLWSANGADGVYYTTNNGTGWTLAAGAPAGSIVRSDRVNSNRFYAFSNGTFYASTNGTSFTASAASGLPTWGTFKTVPGFEGHIWLGNDTGLWRSTDGGTTFTKLTNIEAADSIGFGKAATGQAYPAIYTSGKVSGIRGIYRSIDGGATWVRINDNNNQWAWTGKDITGDLRRFGRVYVATNGRGIIYGDEGAGTPTPVPAAASNLTATTASTSKINLSWTDNSNDESGFKVQRASDANFTTGVVTSSVTRNVTKYAFTSLAAGTTYYFRVQAVNEGGGGAFTTASATTTSLPTSAPAAPSNLASTGTTGTTVSLTWADNSNNEAAFVLERATNSTFTAGLGTYSIAANSTSYTAGGLSNATTYYFRIKATNSVGDSAWSNTVSAKTARR